ncbi:MAG TPA: Na+/H+ antiporter NhaA [Chitinophagaceae bacterium]|jgi:NhaA family Na+:H+ antiporter|nr:Na+/H+ antiporter NhaA [Chitinophagaceae bacterium]
MTGKFSDLFKGFFDSEKIGGLLLLVCTLISLFIANSSIGESYIALMHQKIDLSFSSVSLNYSLEHWVNDGLMAIFFLMVGLEVEREIYIGELAQIKKAILPLAGAVGGICIPALIHFMLNRGTGTAAGFAIPMATDIAFALGILALAGNKVHVSVKIFLTALAIIDDIGAIVVIAFFYTKTVYFTWLLAAFSLLGGMFVLNRLKVKQLLFYIIPGIIMWYCFLQSGVHATLAGVLLAFVIPFHEEDEKNVSNRLLHFLHKPVAFIIVPLFALVNTAIPLPSNLMASLSSPNSLGILIGLIAGKLIGIFSFPFLLVKTGWATLGEGLSWRSLLGIGLLGGIGFTMSMFISNLAFEDPGLVSNSKLSILIGSAFSALAGLAIFMTGEKQTNEEQG